MKITTQSPRRTVVSTGLNSYEESEADGEDFHRADLRNRLYNIRREANIMAYTLPQVDPSNPALPSPVFGDVSAARGDHLRANNNFIWQNFDALAALFDSAGLALDSAKIAGYSAGNASGNVPLSNGSENIGLKAQTARALFSKDSNASSSILDLSVADLAIPGAHYYSILNTDPAAPWSVSSRCVAIGYDINVKLIAWRYNTKATAVRNRVSGVWDTAWTYLTDDNGNAINANSLGGVAAASYALKTDVKLYVNPGSVLQSGSLTNGTYYTASYSGILYVYGTFANGVTGPMSISIRDGSNVFIVFQGGNLDRLGFSFPIKAGQQFVLHSPYGTFTSTQYSIYASIS